MINSITLEGKSYLIGHPNHIEVSQGDPNTGIRFVVNDQEIPYSLDTVFAHNTYGARMNNVTNIMKRDSVSILVPEHIVSLVVMHSLMAGGGLCPDIRITLPNKKKKQEVFVPVLGPGIYTEQHEGLQQLLQTSVRPQSKIACFDPAHLLMSGKQTDAYLYFAPDNKIPQGREGTLSDSNSCVIRIESCVQRDVKATLEGPFIPIEIDYKDNQEEYFSARAMGRLIKWLSYVGVKSGHAIGLFDGITDDNYFLVGPRNSVGSITKSMQPQYRAGFNEHAYHLGVADFPSELAALAASLGVDRIQAEFTMKNMTHEDRLTWLKKMNHDKIFKIDKRK